MRKGGFGKIATLSCFLATLLTVGGAYATWHYGTDIQPQTTEISNVAMGEWETDLVLPGGDISDSHKLLIQDLLSDTIGLNNESTRFILGQPLNGSYLSREIHKRQTNFSRDTLGSMAIKQGDNLAEDFKLDERNLDFLIWFVSDTEYHIFTTSVDMNALKIMSQAQDGDNTDYADGKITITPVYRTIVAYENKEWIEKTSSVGYANSAYYEESQYTNITRSKIASIDPESFLIGEAS